MKKIVALVALAGIASVASAQSLTYGVRLAGSGGPWQFGAVSFQSLDGSPLNFEVAAFATKRVGDAGIGSVVYKTYINANNSVDSASVVEDTTNGDPTGEDGRQGTFNFGPQTHRVFTNRNAGIAGSGFRISSGADAADASAAGGISAKQAPPVDPATGVPNANFDFGPTSLLFRFNLSIACFVNGAPDNARVVNIFTPASRLNSFAVHALADSAATTELKASAQLPGTDISVSWVPAPSSLALLGLGALAAGRRRR